MSEIRGSFIGIYTTNLDIDETSIVSSIGMGCPIGQGFGCGYLDWIMGIDLKCGGSGSSHGGSGGPTLSRT